MARKFVSPGVTTTETDQSFLAQGAAQIGAAVIGRTDKGPAFIPTQVEDFPQFAGVFGDVKTTLPAVYAAKNYLRNSSIMTMVRVLGTKDGQTGVTNGWSYQAGAIVDVSGVMLAEVHYPVGYVLSVSGTGATFKVQVSSGSNTFAASASFNTASSDYIGRVLNTDPTQVGTYYHYLYKNFEWKGTGAGQAYATASISGATTGGLDVDYSNAQTPYVVSQHFGNQLYNLFRFKTLLDGASVNTAFKISITNIKTSLNTTTTRYGTFDVVVRDFYDTDSRPVVIESFTGLDLDPTSINYLPRRIGDQYQTWNTSTRRFVQSGNFSNQSRFIRVEMATGNPPAEALPWGFYGYPENITSTSGTTSLADLPYSANNLDANGNVVGGKLFGVDFSKANIDDRLSRLLEGAAQATGSMFSLSYIASGSLVGGERQYNYTQGTTSSLWPAVPSTASVNGFVFPVYGGFDGWNITVSDPSNLADNAAATDIGVISFKAAVAAISNPESYEMNVLAIPGCVSTKVTDYARQVCSDRADTIFIMDIAGSSVAEVVSKLNARSIDDNYCAVYYPDLKLNDTVNSAIVSVKPSVAVLAAYARNDRVASPHFAPAGMNRGGLAEFGIIDTVDHLTYEDRNTLYDNRVNAIATFPNEGIIVWGQKTLQIKPSALDRVNVRRLLIYAKKTIAAIARDLVFEPNNPSTWETFTKRTNVILEKVRRDRGVERFKVVMDSTVNTPDMIDRNIMVGKIFLQPTRSGEFIDLNFIVTASGVEFQE